MNTLRKHFLRTVLFLVLFQSFPIQSFFLESSPPTSEFCSKSYDLECHDNDQELILIVAAPAAPAVAGITIAAATEVAAGVALFGGFLYSIFWKQDVPEEKVHNVCRTGNNNYCKCGHVCGVVCHCECGCQCGRDNRKKKEEANRYPNGRYEDAGYHHQKSTGNGKTGKSAAPKNGQAALNNSIKLGEGNARIGVSEGQIVVLSQTSVGEFHGHVITFEQLEMDYHGMFKKMKKAGLLDAKGRPLK